MKCGFGIVCYCKITLGKQGMSVSQQASFTFSTSS